VPGRDFSPSCILFFLLIRGDLVCCDWSGRVITCMERAPAPDPVPILTIRLIEGNLLLFCDWSGRMIICCHNAHPPPLMHSRWRRGPKTVL
jgi:hypothetical protein